MSILKVDGGVPLKGTVNISGNKNAILPMIAAAMLTDDEVIFHNVPDIVDVRIMLEVSHSLGARVEFENNSLLIQAGSVCNGAISREHCSKIRTSILFVAPLLYRCVKYRFILLVVMLLAAADWTLTFTVSKNSVQV